MHNRSVEAKKSSNLILVQCDPVTECGQYNMQLLHMQHR